jgi:ElaB/YqjD/DUF883 family membrane-anchored ribosome-binding protein
MTAKKDAKKFGEALELLEEVAKDKKTDLQNLVSEKYGNLKSVLGDVAQGLQKQGKETYEQGIEKVKDLASRSDKSVRQHPWSYLGGTAIGFLILGFFLSRRKST